MGTMRVLTQAGDVGVEWDPADKESVKQAKDEFARLKKEGYEFFEVAETKGKRVTRFNKNLGKVIASPGVQSAQDKTTGARPAAMGGGPNDVSAREQRLSRIREPFAARR